MLRSVASLSLVALTTSFIARDDRVVPNDNRRQASALERGRPPCDSTVQERATVASGNVVSTRCSSPATSRCA